MVARICPVAFLTTFLFSHPLCRRGGRRILLRLRLVWEDQVTASGTTLVRVSSTSVPPTGLSRVWRERELAQSDVGVEKLRDEAAQ